MLKYLLSDHFIEPAGRNAVLQGPPAPTHWSTQKLSLIHILTRNEVFTLAVQKYSDAVYRAAIHNSRCTADAEDVVQDGYEKLLHYNGTFESEEHLKAWLLRVAINRCRDLTRAAHQKRCV